MNKFINKPNHTYDLSDIHGSRPLALHRATNSIDYTLKHDDIEGSRPRGATHKQARSNNPVDPLMPNYKLPSYQLPPDPTPKFLRGERQRESNDESEERSEELQVTYWRAPWFVW